MIILLPIQHFTGTEFSVLFKYFISQILLYLSDYILIHLTNKVKRDMEKVVVPVDAYMSCDEQP